MKRSNGWASVPKSANTQALSNESGTVRADFHPHHGWEIYVGSRGTGWTVTRVDLDLNVLSIGGGKTQEQALTAAHEAAA